MLWLAGVSILVSLMLYAMDAPLVSVIELSVGVGLVTVIFVFAIGLAGELTHDLPSLIPRPLALALVLLAMASIGWLVWPAAQAPVVEDTATMRSVLWELRTVDIWVQIALILAGVLGILNLVADVPAAKTALSDSHKAEAAAAATPKGEASV